MTEKNKKVKKEIVIDVYFQTSLQRRLMSINGKSIGAIIEDELKDDIPFVGVPNDYLNPNWKKIYYRNNLIEVPKGKGKYSFGNKKEIAKHTKKIKITIEIV